MENLFIYQISAIGVIVILVIFINGYVTLQKNTCEKMGLDKIEIDIKDDIKVTSPQTMLDKKLYKMLTWCTDKIIFIDKRVNGSMLKDYPEIKNSVESESRNNVFLMKNKKIMRAIEAGDIETPYPYFLCVKPDGNLNLFMQGKGNRTRITADCADDCTAYVVTANNENITKMKDEAGKLGETDLNNMANIEAKRKFCKLNESFTKVEITIKAKDNLNDVKYIEYMPKICIDDLNKYLESLVIPPYYKIKADPLLMWHFDGLNKGKEKTITYILKLELSDYCKELITGMGIVNSEKKREPYLSKMLNDTVLLVGYSVTMNLSEYFKDPDTEHLNYRIDTFRPNPYVISDAETLYDTQNVTLTGQQETTTPASVEFTATDDELNSISDQFKVDVVPTGTTTPRCDDGEQNGDETGIDCGGACIAPACSLTEGVCAGKTKRCESSGWADCTAADYGADYQATETACDGKDNDCDGEVDEGCGCIPPATQNCYNGPAGTSGTGICRAGTQICSAGSWGACSGEVIPQTEICSDTLDNDCDGYTNCADDDCTGNAACLTCSNECTTSGARQCSGSTAYQQCGNYDADSCLEWSAAISCGTGYGCRNAGECYALQASLSASYSLQRTEQQGAYTYYYFTSTISETNGIGITINSRQKCYQAEGVCDPVRTTISEYYGTNHIVPYGTISNPTNYFYSSYHPQTMTETFWGTDDNGNFVTISYQISVS